MARRRRTRRSNSASSSRPRPLRTLSASPRRPGSKRSSTSTTKERVVAPGRAGDASSSSILPSVADRSSRGWVMSVEHSCRLRSDRRSIRHGHVDRGMERSSHRRRRRGGRSTRVEAPAGLQITLFEEPARATEPGRAGLRHPGGGSRAQHLSSRILERLGSRRLRC
jgi:hypothetical protein